MARYFLTKTAVEPGTLVEVAGTPVLARHDVLMQALTGVVDPAGAGVLAEPMLSFGNDQAPSTIVWYSSYPGEARKLSELDRDRREAVVSTLRVRLADIAGRLSDPSFGPLVGAALNVLDPDDVWVVDGQPVLVGWGMVPPEANRSGDARNRHFAVTMARHLPIADAPPVTPREPEVPRPEPGGLRSGGGGEAPPPQVVHRGQGGGGWRWVPLGLLLLVTIVALAWLLLPGTRIMPPVPEAALIEDEEALQIAREVNATLESRAEELEAAIAGAVCTPQGDLVLPGGLAPDDLLPPIPGRVVAPPGSRQGESVAALEEPASLLQLIEDRTVLVLVDSEEGGLGSGFFVGPDLLMTNHHVIEGGGDIYVVNKRLGALHLAQVLSWDGPLETTGGDFALLRVEGADSPFFAIRDSGETLRLESVIAAGYPGVILETDENFLRLLEGDASAIPDVAVTEGIVNVEQTFLSSVRAVIHTASISSGNSGGPLVDGCGRVVGINTFTRLEERTSRALNFALAATEVVGFLEESGVETQRSYERCSPAMEAAQPPVEPVGPDDAGEPEEPATES